MKPILWPDWLNCEALDLWAKSRADKDEKKAGESLACHTWLVLARLAELARLRPQLATQLKAPRFWHCLFWACFLHDFGKAARGFQVMLRTPEQRWQRRHEVLSLAFLDWIAPAFSELEQEWLLAAIASHHRDANYITVTHTRSAGLVEEMLAELDEGTVRGLWKWLAQCSTAWITALGFPAFGVQAVTPISEGQAVQQVCQEGVERVYKWLDTYAEGIEKWKRARSYQLIPTLVMLRGLTTTADHAASAHLVEIPKGIQGSWQALNERVIEDLRQQQRNLGEPEKPVKTHWHQRECVTRHSHSALLVAPTGSGKTEAALFWALGDGNEPLPRLFYTLPYQASMNAMYHRLSGSLYFGEQTVGLQHGRAWQTLYTRLLQAEDGPASAAEATRWLTNLNRLHAYPVKVFSPYQMLKVLYQLKGFEGMLTDYTQAAFIFDEIHAYDANRLALILALIKHLRERYGARFLVMSATLPSLLGEIMPEILGIQKPIVAEESLFQEFCRHSLSLLDGDLFEQGIERILAEVKQEKSVLVCCNTVQRAQEMRAALLRFLPADQVELLHSRFTMRDRFARELAILEQCRVGAKRKALAVVATQVVEVSLNIDLDTIYTDPAPLDALIQRFGRVNRARKKGIVPVHVFREPRDGQGIYQEFLVQRTLDELELHKGGPIDEAAIGKWLDAIYNEPAIRDPWKKTYEQQFQLAEKLLRDLRPFNSDDAREKEFEKLFDGTEVLPQSFEKAYLEHMERHEFIEAAQLFVPISQKKYQQLANHGKIRPLEEQTGKRWMVAQAYDPALGLLFGDSLGQSSDEY